MKFKTWEKVYWGIIAVFFVLGIVFVLFNKGDVPVNIQGEHRLISKGTFIGYSLFGHFIIFVPIWLIARFIVNRNDTT